MQQLFKNTGWIVLLVNLAVLSHYILFKNEPGTFRVHHASFSKRQSGVNTTPFASVKKIYYSNKSSLYKYKNIGGNILGFVPLGFLLPFLVFRRYGIILSILSVSLLSTCFEYIQLYTGCGVFDVDDIILNSLGGITGALLWGILQITHYFLSKKRELTNFNFAVMVQQDK